MGVRAVEEVGFGVGVDCWVGFGFGPREFVGVVVVELGMELYGRVDFCLASLILASINLARPIAWVMW